MLIYLVLNPWNPHVSFIIFFERLVNEGFIILIKNAVY